FDDNLSLQKLLDHRNVGEQMLREATGRELRWLRRQCQRQNNLVGTMRINGRGRTVEMIEKLVYGLIGDALGRLPALAQTKEHRWRRRAVQSQAKHRAGASGPGFDANRTREARRLQALERSVSLAICNRFRQACDCAEASDAQHRQWFGLGKQAESL